jgi:hypothetical protein
MINKDFYKLEDRSNHNCGEINKAKIIYVSDLAEQAKISKIYIGDKPYPDVNYVKIINTTTLDVKYDLFGDMAFPFDADQFMAEKQCECVLWSYPDKKNIKNWHLFIETKYVKKSITRYKDEIINQLLSSVQWFRKNGYLDNSCHVYGLGAFPLDFNYRSSQFQKPTLEFNYDGKRMTLRQIEKEYKVKIKFTRLLEIENKEKLNFRYKEGKV